MKRFFKITVRRVLAMVVLMSMLLTGNANLLLAYAAGENVVVSAKVYRDSALNTELADLADQNTQIANWEQNTTRTLHVSINQLDNPGAGSYYQLVVQMDRALYLSVPDRTAENWVESQSQTKYSAITVNTNQKLAANANSGTVTYRIKNGTSSVGASFELNYDWVFWDQRDNSVLGYNARYLNDTVTPLLSVKLQLVSGNTITDVYSGKLDSAISAEGASQNASLGAAVDIVEHKTVYTISMGEVVAMRYNGISGYLAPGDYVLTVTAPSYTDPNGTTHFMEFDSSGDYFISGTGGGRVYVTPVITRENDNSPWVATYTFRNAYFHESSPYYFFGIKLPESVIDYDLNPVDDMPVFSGGSVKAKIVETVNNEEKVFNLADKTAAGAAVVTMTSTQVVSLSVSHRTYAYMIYSQKDQVQLFDIMAVANSGVIDARDVTVRFRFDTENFLAAGVTDVVLPVPKGQSVTVYFKMWQVTTKGSTGAPSGYKILDQWMSAELTNTSGKDAPGARLSRIDLDKYNPAYAPYSSGDYYFKEIVYVIDNIPKGVNLYSADGKGSPNSAGTFWGYMLKEWAGAYEKVNGVSKWVQKNHNIFEVYVGNVLSGESGDLIADAIEKRHINVDRTVSTADERASTNPKNPYTANKAAYCMDTMQVREVGGTKDLSCSIEPGESAVVSVKLWMREYAYSYRLSASNLRLALLLPNDVTLTGVKATLQSGISYQSGGTQGDADNIGIHTQAQDDPSQTLWIITLPSHIEIGYFREGLIPVEDGPEINLEFTVSTEQDTTPKSIILSEGRLFVAGLKQPQVLESSGYVGNHYSAYDTYNLVGVDDAAAAVMAEADKRVGSVLDTHQTVTLSIKQTQALVDISNRFVDTGTQTTELGGITSTVRYELSINCTRGGSINDFYYYVPVPKAEDHSTEFVSDSDINFNLIDRASLTYSSEAATRLTVLYTTAKSLTYAQLTAPGANNSIQWLTEAEVTDWSEVTMMKLIPENPGASIVNGSEIQLTAEFEYAMSEESYIKNAGKAITWKSLGYYEYVNSTNTNSGHYPTDDVELLLTYTAPEQQITLVAGADNAADKTQMLDIDDILAQFDNSVSFHVADVKTYGDFSLWPVESIQWDDLDSEQSNVRFGITAQLNENTPVNVEDNADMKASGTSTNESVKFQIYHGNAITENVSPMVVTLNLVGSNRTVIPVRIVIERVLTPAEPGDPGIKGGNHYALFPGMANPQDDDSVTITRESAATAQFVFSYIPTLYNTPVLTVTDGSVQGKIIMIDSSNSAEPVYYWADAAPSITLTSFKKLIGSGSYTHSNSNTEVKQSLLFVLPQVKTDGQITLTMTGKTNASTVSSTLTYAVGEPRTFSLSADAASKKLGEDITFSYNTNCADLLTGENDSTYQRRQAALVITGTNMPADLLLEAGGTTYRRNADAEYIIPLDNAQNANGSVVLRPSSNTLVKQNISLTAQLYVGADLLSGSRPKTEQVGSPVTVTLTPVTDAPAFKVVSMSTGRVLTSTDLNTQIRVTTDWLNITSSNITVELYKADGFGYASTNYMNAGYSWSGKEFRMSLNALTATGTYQLRFKVVKGDVEMVIPYNFVLIDG